MSPDPDELAAYDMTAADRTFHRALAAELASLGYSLGPSSRPGEPFEIRAGPSRDSPQRQPDAITIAPSEGLRRFIEAEQQLREDRRHPQQPWMSVSDPSGRTEPSGELITAPAPSAEERTLPRDRAAEPRTPLEVDQAYLIREKLDDLAARRTDREVYRRLLGERRMGALETSVAEVRASEFLSAMETAELTQETATLRDAFAAEFGDPLKSVNRKAMYRTLRNERDLANVEEHLQETLDDLAYTRGVKHSIEPMTETGPALLERADAAIGELRDNGILPQEGSPDRHPPYDLTRGLRAFDLIRAQGKIILSDRDSLQTLRSEQQELQDRGVHLDQQLDPQIRGHLAGIWAREDELASRLQVELAGLDERAAMELPEAGIQPAIPEHTAQRTPDPPGVEM